MANVTKPVLLDETGQDIVAGLTGIANAVQPINIYLDVQMSIPVSGWSVSTPHTYNWLYQRITAECGIEVHFMEGAEDVDMKYLEYDKIAGGIQFTIDEIPDKAIPLMVRIINAQTSAVIDPVDDTLITSDAVPGTVNVHEALVDHESRLSGAEGDVSDIQDKLDDVDDELALRLKSVNGVPADEHGDVIVDETEFARQIVTDDAQQSTGLFLFRTTGGDASLSDGPAKLVSISGRRVHTGEAVESINLTVHAAQRTAPAAITAVLDKTTFEAYVSEAGVYTLIYTNSWTESPALYGITVTGTPLEGDMITVSWDAISDPVMTVIAPRYAPPDITAAIDRDTFKAYVANSGTYTLSYTSDWSEDPALYGVTVSNTPISGDSIVIVYVKSDRGTIAVSDPTKFVSTGWNLYDNSTGKKYARVKKYSTTYGFLIGGSYASLAFAETLSGTQTAITPASGYFTVPSDGYVFVTGGDSTTYIMMTWSDWTEGYQGSFQAYTESVVDLSTIMNDFPYGLMQVGAVSDEINFSMMRAISRIDRLEYSDANLEYAEASGMAYEVDTNYIYIVKEVEDVYTISETGAYTASDHGCEIVDGDVPVYVQTLYGQNLVDKLRTDVVTKSQDLVDNLTSTAVNKALTAKQGKELKDIMSNVVFSTVTTDVLADAVNVTGTKVYQGSGSSYTGTVPNVNYKYGSFIVTTRGQERRVIATPEYGGIAVNTYDSGVWRGWIEFVSKARMENVAQIIGNGFSQYSYITVSLVNCTGSFRNSSLVCGYNDEFVCIQGAIRVNSVARTGSNPGVSFTLPVSVPDKNFYNAIMTTAQPTEFATLHVNGTGGSITVSESISNYTGTNMTIIVPYTVIKRS